MFTPVKLHLLLLYNKGVIDLANKIHLYFLVVFVPEQERLQKVAAGGRATVFCLYSSRVKQSKTRQLIISSVGSLSELIKRFTYTFHLHCHNDVF